MSDPINRRKTDLSSPNPSLSLSITELTAVLVKHYGLNDGKYELAIEFQIGVGPVGPPNEQLLPGVIFGVKSVGLSPAKGDTLTSVDASTLGSEHSLPKKTKARKSAKVV